MEGFLPPFRVGPRLLSRPVDDHWEVTCGFGYDITYPANNHWHFGKDYGTGVGSPCWFRESGTIVLAGPGLPLNFQGVANGAWGNYVEMKSDHDPSVHWGLAHLSRIDVNVGQHVQAGEVVGLTGGQPGQPGAGTSTGPHCHEQKLVNGVRVDPDG